MNRLYDKGLEKFATGAIDWSSDNIKVLLVDAADYAVNIASDEFHSDVTSGGIVATSGNLASKTYTAGVLGAADVTFTSVTGDQCEALVIYKDTGTSGTSPLIAYIDTANGLPVTPSGVDITVSWDSGKILRL